MPKVPHQGHPPVQPWDPHRRHCGALGGRDCGALEGGGEERGPPGRRRRRRSRGRGRSPTTRRDRAPPVRDVTPHRGINPRNCFDSAFDPTDEFPRPKSLQPESPDPRGSCIRLLSSEGPGVTPLRGRCSARTCGPFPSLRRSLTPSGVRPRCHAVSLPLSLPTGLRKKSRAAIGIRPTSPSLLTAPKTPNTPISPPHRFDRFLDCLIISRTPVEWRPHLPGCPQNHIRSSSSSSHSYSFFELNNHNKGSYFTE